MKNINKLLENWFSENLDIDLTFKKGSRFEYEDDTETIFYSFNEKSVGDKYFRELCEKLYPEASQFNDFTLSLFHEVGHSQSDPFLSDKVLDDYDDFMAELGDIDNPDEKTYKKYYNHPVEKSATKVGMALLKSSHDQAKELEQAIFGKNESMDIVEFKERPNTHQTHFEDLVLLGSDGLGELNDKIEKFLNRPEELNQTTKIDGCLHPDTLIKTTEGDIPISEIIQNSNKVYIGYGKDELTGEIKEIELNLPRVINGDRNWYTITMENGHSITATENHLFKVEGDYKSVDELSIGDNIEEL